MILAETIPLYKCKGFKIAHLLVQDITPELRRQRALFQGAAAAVGTSGSGAGGNAVLSVHRMTLASTDHTLNPTTSGGGKPRSRSQTFLVGQSNGGGSDGPMAEFAEEVGKLFGAPWGGVACPMSPAGKPPPIPVPDCKFDDHSLRIIAYW